VSYYNGASARGKSAVREGREEHAQADAESG
jgi:hypothetical protein